MASDAHGADPGGDAVGVLLVIDRGYLSDVEVYSNVEPTFAGVPDPSALKPSEWTTPDEFGTRRLLRNAI